MDNTIITLEGQTYQGAPSLLLPSGLWILGCSFLLLCPDLTCRSPADQTRWPPSNLQHRQTHFQNNSLSFIKLLNQAPPLPLPLASDAVAPQSSLSTTGAKAMYPSTQCFLMVSMMEGGKWMWRSHRNTMLWSSWGLEHTSILILHENTCDFQFRALLSVALTLTFIRSMPACRPAERSKFPLRFTYSYLNDTQMY